MAEWDIHKPLGVCAGSGRAIVPDEEYIAALVEITGGFDTSTKLSAGKLTVGGFERRDYSAEYWMANRPAVYCYWKSVMPKDDKKKKIFVDDDMLLSFFERLAAETDEEKINFRFVLTLVLMRKRLVKYDSSEKIDGKEIWTVKITGRDEKAQVVNPNLTEDKIEQLSEQLGQILQMEFNSR